MRSLLFTLTAFVLAFALECGHAAPALPGPQFPVFKNAEALVRTCKRRLAEAGQRVAALEKVPPSERWLAAYDDLNAFIEDAAGPIGLLPNVHPNADIRYAAQACELRWQAFNSALSQNELLYYAARQIKPRDAIDKEFLRVTLEGFEDAGVALPKPKRARAKTLADHIADLGLRFDRNVREDPTKVAYAPAELHGVPEAVWKDAKRDAEGRVLLGLDYPTYMPVVQLAENPRTRERMWRAKVNEGGDANLKLLKEIAGARREYAALFGMASYDDFVLRRRMARSLAWTQAFLNDVKAVVTDAERHETNELRAAKAEHTKQPLNTVTLDRWDVAFYTERVRRERYAVDQEAFRSYFPPKESLKFVMRVIEKMLGVRYVPVPARLWHPDAQAFAVLDATTETPLATLYVDPYPRDNKYNHAAVWSIRNGSQRTRRVPQAALVVNLDRKGLTLDDLETLLHEFGHSVHNNLSATRYASQAGTNVLQDFVEAPSQMLEDWIYDKRVMAVFAEVCPACKPVPAAMLDRALAARDYGKGMMFSRQHLYASYDLALYGAEPVDPMALWARMEGATPLGYVPGTKFPAGFSHVASNYSAGYYSYLWSLVVAMDLRTAFAANKLDPTVGMRYRKTVLAEGAQRPPLELMRDFLQRDVNSKAFFDYLRK